MEINHLDLFSGIGGFHLGFEKAGYKVNAFFSEVDQHAIAVYKHQFPNSTYVGSVTDVRGQTSPESTSSLLEVIARISALPESVRECLEIEAPLSRKQLGLLMSADQEYLCGRMLKELSPQTMAKILRPSSKRLPTLGAIHSNGSCLIQRGFSPQNRERIYLVGYLGRPRHYSGSVFPINETSGEDIPMEGARAAVSKTLTARGQADLHSGLQLVEVQYTSATDIRGNETIATIRQGGRGSITPKHSWDIIETTEKYAGPHEVVQLNQMKVKLDENYTYQKANDVVRNHEFAEGEVKAIDFYNRSVRDDSPTLTDPKHNAVGVFEGRRIRRLTPIECERLQGFPDNHTKYGMIDGNVTEMANTHRYKQCGNAVTVDVVEAVARRIKINHLL